MSRYFVEGILIGSDQYLMYAWIYNNNVNMSTLCGNL